MLDGIGHGIQSKTLTPYLNKSTEALKPKVMLKEDRQHRVTRHRATFRHLVEHFKSHSHPIQFGVSIDHTVPNKTNLDLGSSNTLS